MASFRLRKLLRSVHLWVGLCLAILFIPLGLSGSWLVFSDDFDRMLHPHRYHATAADMELSPSKYFGAAQQAFGARARVAQLRMPEDDGQPAVVSSAKGLTAWLDPASGKVLDVGNPRVEIRALAHQFHETLFLAQPGRRIVGWLGVAMFISSVTGLIIWWPPNNAIIKGLRWRRSPLVWSNIHHLVGFWSSLLLAILSLTGVALAFPELLRPSGGAHGMERFGGPRGRLFAGPTMASPHLSADEAVALAEKAENAMDFMAVSLPTQGDEPSWRVTVLGSNGTSMVAVDDKTGQASASTGFQGRAFEGGRSGERRFGGPAEGRRGPNPAMRVVRLLHAGNDAGFAWRIVIFIVGLIPSLLGITGVLIWLKTRRRSEAVLSKAG